MKNKIILGAVGAAVVLIAIIVGLFMLGGDHQSALEKLRDISIIFIVLLGLLNVILLAGITAALVWLAFQIKDRIIPLLEEATGTVARVRTTTNFVSEEAVKPIISFAGQFSKIRAMGKTVTGKNKKAPKAPDFKVNTPSATDPTVTTTTQTTTTTERLHVEPKPNGTTRI